MPTNLKAPAEGDVFVALDRLAPEPLWRRTGWARVFGLGFTAFFMVLLAVRLVLYRDLIDLVVFLAFVLLFAWRLRVLRRIRHAEAIPQANR